MAENGLFVDELQILADGDILLSDGAEGSSAFTLAGFVKSNGNEAKDHYYLAEWRNHAGVDKGWPHQRGRPADALRAGHAALVRGQQPGQQLGGVHPGEGFLGVVDDQRTLKWSDGAVAGTRYQIHDATFSLGFQQPLNLKHPSGPCCATSGSPRTGCSRFPQPPARRSRMLVACCPNTGSRSASPARPVT